MKRSNEGRLKTKMLIDTASQKQLVAITKGLKHNEKVLGKGSAKKK
jgi:hypothetical protein